MKRFKYPVRWARLGPASAFLARRFKTLLPPILILSFPRSGSSWVGEILGSAANALYLREPITQCYLALGNAERTVFDIDPADPPYAYKYLADMAFLGLPSFPRNILRNPKQWSLFERQFRHLVIKEVNPLAFDWFLKRYNPRVIFLVRHPAAVALSFLNLGWTDINVIKDALLATRRLIDGPLSQWKQYLKFTPDFWERHGILQGAVLRNAIDSLQDYTDYRVVLYEELCADPLSLYKDLFNFTGLLYDRKVEKSIVERSSGGSRKNPYSTSRNSSNMINSWENRLSVKELEKLRSAYCTFNLPWYKSPDSWYFEEK